MQRFVPLNKISSITLDNTMGNCKGFFFSKLNIVNIHLCKTLNTSNLLFNQLQCNLYSPIRKYSSALYTTVDKLTQHCSYVTPHFDIVKVLESQGSILNNLKLRKLDTCQYNFVKMKELHEKFISVEKALSQLDFKILELEDHLHRNKAHMTEDEIESKNKEKRDLRVEIRKYDSFILEYERHVIIKILNIPNNIDSNTPDAYETIHEFAPSTVKQNGNCLKKLTEYVKYNSKININYLGAAAKFKYLFPIYMKEHFMANHKFIPFSNTDVCRGVIVEGSGTPHMCPYANIVLVNNQAKVGDVGYDERRYHLVGSGHMSMFCAYHTNQSVNVKDLPLRYISSGKRYGFQSLLSVAEISEESNTLIEKLYNSVQKETVTIFVGTKNQEELSKEIDQIDNIFKSLFLAVELKHRICRSPAPSLHPSESARLEYQLFSDLLNTWVTCADVCVNEDYISKRLNMCHHTSVTSYDKHFLHVLNANLYVNVLLLNFIEKEKNLDVEQMKKLLASI